MTALMFQTTTSTDSEARATIDQMNRTNTEMFNRLLEGIAAEDIPNITFGLNAAMSSSLAGVLAGMMTLEESSESRRVGCDASCWRTGDGPTRQLIPI